MPSKSRAAGSVKPDGKASAGQSTLGHLFASEGEFELEIQSCAEQLDQIKGLLSGLKDRLKELTLNAQKDINSTIAKNDEALDQMLQDQADEIEQLAQVLQQRLNINAPIDLQISAAQSLSVVDQYM